MTTLRRFALIAGALALLGAPAARAACPLTPNLGLEKCDFQTPRWDLHLNTNVIDKLDFAFLAPLSLSGTDVSLGVVPETKGGTNQSTYTLGEILYASGPDTLAKLPGNTTIQRKFLRQTGNGTISAAPVWDTLLATDLPDITTANGATWARGSGSENITLSTSGSTSDSSGNLLPADSIIQGVACRVTTTITTATDWSVGDANVPDRFSSADAELAVGTVSVGMNHHQGSVAADTAGPVQAAAAALRITTTGWPGAGAIRCTVFYDQFTAPTS